MIEVVPATAPRRPRRRLVVWLVVLVLLAGVLVGGDQVARVLAQRTVAQQVQTQLNLPATPSVQIHGFPFLTQFAPGRFSQVDLSAAAADVTIYDHQVRLNAIQASAYDVVATQRFSRIVAGRGELTAVLPWAAVQTLTGLQFGSGGDGKVAVRFDGTFGGAAVTGTATGRPVLDVENQRLSFSDVSVDVTSGAEVQVANAVGQVVFAPIPVDQIPYGLRVTAVQARDDGLLVSTSGQDIPLRQP